MELRHLRYFVAVAEYLHFGKAASTLRIAQPSLSRQIRDLEREVGVPLFERTRHRVELTAAGFAFLEEARALVSRSDRSIALAREAAQGRFGAIRIGFSLAALGPALVESFRVFSSRHPSVTIRARMLSDGEQFAQLTAGQIDGGFAHIGSTGEAPAGLEHVSVTYAPLVAAVPRGHRLAERPTLLLKDLRGERLLVISGSTDRALHRRVRDLCATAGYEPAVTQEFDDEASLLSLVGAGLGSSIVPISWSRLNVSDVEFLPLEPPSEMGVGFFRRSESMDPSLRSFLAVVEQVADSAGTRSIAG